MAKELRELLDSLSEYFSRSFNLPIKEAQENAYNYTLVLSAYKHDLLQIATLAEKKGIRPNVIIDSLALAIRISESEEEKNPVGTGAIIGNTDEILENLGTGLVTGSLGEVPFSPRHWDWIIDKVKSGVDGLVAAFCVDGDSGFIADARKLPEHLNSYLHITEKVSKSIALHVPKTKLSVRLYSDGEMAHQLVKVRNLGLWMNRNLPTIRLKISNLCCQKEVKPETANTVLDFALQLSETRKGGTYVVGAIDELLGKVRAKKLSKIEKKHLSTLGKEEIVNYSTKDGATLIDQDGFLVSFGVKFIAEGGRFASAREVTQKVKDVFAIVTSVDGKVQVVSDGESLPIID